MSLMLPEVTENELRDASYQVWLCRPWTPNAQSYVGRIADVFDAQVTVNRRGIPVLSFKTHKDSANQELLHAEADRESGQEEYSLAVRVWDWRVKDFIEPRDCRFIVDRWETNDADPTNVITYQCRAELTRLDWGRLDRTPNAYALNRDYDRAREAYEEAERAYDSIIRQAESAGRAIQEDRFGHTNGRILVGYSGLGWLAAQFQGVRRWGTIVADAQRRGIFAYRPSDGTWLRLPITGTDTDRQRQQLVDLIPQVASARARLRRTRDAYAKAERAARETSRDGTRFFHNRTPARVLATAWMEAAQRDSERRWGRPYNRYQAKGFWRDWTTERDGTGGSGVAGQGSGRRWVTTTTQGNWEFPLGAGILQMVGDFCEKGELDYCTRGRIFSIVPYGALEVDQTQRVVLRLDESVTEAVERGDRSQHFSHALVVGGNGYPYMLEWGPNIATSATPWGHAEGTISESDADGRQSANELTRPAREIASHREVRESVRTYPVDAGTPLPLVDFHTHHWISVWDTDGAQSPRIVDQIIVRFGDDQPAEATVVLGTRHQRGFTRFARTTSQVLGGFDYIQGHIPVSPRLNPPSIPRAALYAPPLMLGQPRISFNTESGQPQVILPFTWGEVEITEPDDPGAFEASVEIEDDTGGGG